jgi:hypothetical protein
VWRPRRFSVTSANGSIVWTVVLDSGATSVKKGTVLSAALVSPIVTCVRKASALNAETGSSAVAASSSSVRYARTRGAVVLNAKRRVVLIVSALANIAIQSYARVSSPARISSLARTAAASIVSSARTRSASLMTRASSASVYPASASEPVKRKPPVRRF